MNRHKPTVEEVRAARGRRLPDVVTSGLGVVFCGINPGLYSAAVGCHFARPGNRFWKTLYEAGFTDCVLSPWEQARLLEYGCGITNLVARATVVAAELTSSELRRGRGVLKRKLKRHCPRYVAVLGIGAYRTAFEAPDARVGPQKGELCGARVWLLPNPSGLNAYYQQSDLTRLFRDLRDEVEGA
jgi:TDG/mug DNA glycosylase family protein